MDLTSGLAPLLGALREAGASETLVLELAALPSGEVRQWVATMDGSPYGVVDWARALVRFSEWESKHRKLPPEQKREYLSCCIEGAGSAFSLLSLEALLESYLTSHGVRD